ncbi:serine/threonine/tyrosine-interacting protein-like [Diorhabda sublineata]|uniref:serine/threonine/tyrosine-interacting protein-like n=1 Tax=Diorhabda sublineata TaxID=1163346 RepID=UPI0024E0F608|nr:serine/threonine/tyrosine-interacting protein-like [Diorhabda sublineata]
MIDVTPQNFLQDEANITSVYNQRSFHLSRQIHVAKTMQEIIPGVYLGPFTAAQKTILIENGINYVICVRQDVEANVIKPQINDPTFAYLTLNIADNVTENIIRFFPKVKQFIDEALSNNCKVLVHSKQGNSRSATLVLAYIMEKFGLTSSEALQFVRTKRATVDPNEGFRAQLIEYEPIYKARQILANGETSQDCRSKRKCEQLTETVDYNLIQRPPSPVSDNHAEISVKVYEDFSDHLYRLLRGS